MDVQGSLSTYYTHMCMDKCNGAVIRYVLQQLQNDNQNLRYYVEINYKQCCFNICGDI